MTDPTTIPLTTDYLVGTILRELAAHWYPRDVLSGLLAMIDVLRLEDGQDEVVFPTRDPDLKPTAPRTQTGTIAAAIGWPTSQISITLDAETLSWEVGGRVEVRPIGANA